MFSLIGALIIGLLVGAIAKLLMPGRDPGGILVTMALGVAGALVATFLGRSLGWYAADQSAGFLMSIVGAVLILFLYRLVVHRRPARV